MSAGRHRIALDRSRLRDHNVPVADPQDDRQPEPQHVGQHGQFVGGTRTLRGAEVGGIDQVTDDEADEGHGGAGERGTAHPVGADTGAAGAVGAVASRPWRA